MKVYETFFCDGYGIDGLTIGHFKSAYYAIVEGYWCIENLNKSHNNKIQWQMDLPVVAIDNYIGIASGDSPLAPLTLFVSIKTIDVPEGTETVIPSRPKSWTNKQRRQAERLGRLIESGNYPCFGVDPVWKATFRLQYAAYNRVSGL